MEQEDCYTIILYDNFRFNFRFNKTNLSYLQKKAKSMLAQYTASKWSIYQDFKGKYC